MRSGRRNYGSLPDIHSQQTSVIKNRRGRKLYRWRIDKLEVKEKQQEFQQEMDKNAVQFSELWENIGTTKNDIEREMQERGLQKDGSNWSRPQQVN